MQIGKLSLKAISALFIVSSLLMSTAFTQEVKIDSIDDFRNLNVDTTNPNNKKEIKVHVVPHTHDTLDGYGHI